MFYLILMHIINNSKTKLKMQLVVETTMNKIKDMLFKNWSPKYGNFDILVNIFN